MKLTLRELFLLVALVAMGCGWWVDRGRLATKVEELAARVEELQQHILDGLRGTEAMMRRTQEERLERFQKTGSFGTD